jgi:hypothetical protein
MPHRAPAEEAGSISVPYGYRLNAIRCPDRRVGTPK